jgi:lipopolysaccharide export system permease protein
MRIIDKYMTRGFVAPFIWCLFIFVVMAVIIDIFSFIEDIVKFHIPASSIFAFYIYYTPTIVVQVAPMAMLLSTIFILSNLNKHNELIAMKSSGISLWRIMMPLVMFGIIISMMAFIVNDRVIPISSKVSNAIRRDELEKEKRRERRNKIVENVALYGAGNKILFARNYDIEKKILNDIIIHEHDAHENLISKITAQNAVWTGKAWRFNKVIMYRIDNSGKILGEPLFYEDKLITLREKPSDFANREWQSDYMSYGELKKYIKNFKGTSTKVIRSLLVDLHYKVSFAFINLVIVLIGAPFAMINTRGGVMIGIGMSIVIGLLYYAFIALSLAFGKAGILSPVLSAWLGNIVFTFIGIYLINKAT